MSIYKKLAGQTAIYGLSSILGRFINFLLVPLYTRIFDPAAYGIVSELYAYVTFFIILYTYGLEIAYFRYVSKEGEGEKVYNTILYSVIITSVVFSGLLILFSAPIAGWLRYPHHHEYIIYFAFILALDAITSIAFAHLRYYNKAWRFALIRLSNIFLNVLLNLFFLLLCPYLAAQGNDLVNYIYSPQIGIGYIFISNLISSGATLLMLLPQIKIKIAKINFNLWKDMFRYSLPLMVAGFAGMINETIDRILLKYMYPAPLEIALEQVGVYSACYKLAIFMTLFIQTYRYAVEPFFFAHAKNETSKKDYAQMLNYFTIAGVFIFLGITLFLDFFKNFIGKEYHSGLHVVPILLLANLLLGIYYNLTIWYKLTDKTNYGAGIAIAGAAVTLLVNIIFIPRWGITASAMATLLCYLFMTILSFTLGQKFYPVPYQVSKILLLICSGIVLYLAKMIFLMNQEVSFFQDVIVSIVLLLVFTGIAAISESKKVVI